MLIDFQSFNRLENNPVDATWLYGTTRPWNVHTRLHHKCNRSGLSEHPALIIRHKKTRASISFGVFKIFYFGYYCVDQVGRLDEWFHHPIYFLRMFCNFASSVFVGAALSTAITNLISCLFLIFSLSFCQPETVLNRFFLTIFISFFWVCASAALIKTLSFKSKSRILSLNLFFRCNFQAQGLKNSLFL